MWKFKILLWLLSNRLQKAAVKNGFIKDYIKGKEASFNIQTACNAGRGFTIKDGKITSSTELLEEPSFSLKFSSAQKAFKVLKSKDDSVFMASTRDGNLKILGDFSELVWFMKMVKDI